jgi:hypothetical protein
MVNKMAKRLTTEHGILEHSGKFEHALDEDFMDKAAAKQKKRRKQTGPGYVKMPKGGGVHGMNRITPKTPKLK